MQSIIKPKEPKGAGWIHRGLAPTIYTLGYEGHQWFYPEQGIAVISAVEVASDPGDIEKGPEYHVSISKNGGRCTRNETKFVQKVFDMQDSDEDNHVPGGFVRNFWKPVAENLIGHVCPCKDHEPEMAENKGDFVWRGITR